MPVTEFSDEKFQRAYPEGIEHHYWTIARQRIIFRHLKKIIFAPGDLILDVGCGRGIVVSWLRQRGIDAVGCDAAVPAPINRATAPFLHLGIAAENLPPHLAQRVRIILLLDVLEHLSVPMDLLRGLFNHFPNADRVLFTVPARKELWSNYDEFYGHTMRYDLANARNLARACGCELQYAGYFFHSLWIPVRLAKTMGKTRSTQIFPPRASLRAVHRAIASAFVLEEMLMPKALIGTSILGILRRPR